MLTSPFEEPFAHRLLFILIQRSQFAGIRLQIKEFYCRGTEVEHQLVASFADGKNASTQPICNSKWIWAITNAFDDRRIFPALAFLKLRPMATPSKTSGHWKVDGIQQRGSEMKKAEWTLRHLHFAYARNP